MAIANPIITRKEAKALGLTRYNPGSTCKHGHISERSTVNGLCLECGRIKQHNRYLADREGELAKQKLARQAPGYYEKRQKKRHANDPALAARVTARSADLAARENAKADGKSMYASPRPCIKCGTAQRFTGDGHCVQCNRIACGARDPVKRERLSVLRATREERKSQLAKRAEAYKAIRDSRRAAFASGSKTYIGRPCPEGHSGLRYTGYGSCVECAAINAASAAKKAYDAKYFAKNRERLLERSRRYNAAHPERINERTREWVRRNPEKRRAIADNYKHRRRSQEAIGMSSVEFMEWKKAQRKVCYWCGIKCEHRFEVDHYVALSKGGAHVASNLVISCRSCNAQKHARDPIEFAQSRGRLL